MAFPRTDRPPIGYEQLFICIYTYLYMYVCVCMYVCMYAGIEFKDFILGFRQSTFLCTTLKCIEQFRIPFIKSGIPASNLGSSEARRCSTVGHCVTICAVHGRVIPPCRDHCWLTPPQTRLMCHSSMPHEG